MTGPHHPHQPNGGWQAQPAPGQVQSQQQGRAQEQPRVQPMAQPQAYAGASARGGAYAASTTYAAQAAQAQAQAQAQAAAARQAATPADYDFRKGATPAEPPPPPVETKPGHPRAVRSGLGPLSIGQLVAWQVAGAATLLAYKIGDLIVAGVTAAVALILVSPTLIRYRGRWLYRWFGVWNRFRGRSHRAPATGEGAALDLLTFAEPTVSLRTEELDDREIALLAHRGGVCAVLELGPDDTALLSGEPVRLPSPVTLLPVADAHASPITAQLLVSITPAPVVGPGVVERSYRELTGGEVPAQRRSWLVMQAVRSADAYTDAELRPVLLSAVRRARRQMRMEKIQARVLDRDGLISAVNHLGRLSDANRGAAARRNGGQAVAPPPADPARPTGRETWRSSYVEEVPHTCRRVVTWPVRAWQPEELLLKLPTVGSVLSLAVTHNTITIADTEDVFVEVAFRLVAPDANALAGGDKALDQAVRAAGGRTERFDGEQVIGLAATLPLGGFLP